MSLIIKIVGILGIALLIYLGKVLLGGDQK